MRSTKRLKAALWAMLLLGLTLFLAPVGAQTVMQVSAEVRLTGQEVLCELQYALKNGKQELKEVPLSGILYHGSDIGELSARDGSGTLSVSGSSSGDKLALAQPLAPEADYTFTVTYSVPGALQRKAGYWILSAPLIHTPWRPRLSKEPAMTIRGVLPEGMNFIWSSPRYLKVERSAGQVVVSASSAVLASYFRIEYKEGRVGFFTPGTTAIVAFFGGAAILIAIWLVYAFGRKRTATA
jgi:hypothetical protein